SRLVHRQRREFLNLRMYMMIYAGRSSNLFTADWDADSFQQLSTEEKVSLRDKLYEAPSIMDSFVAENPFELSEEELSICRGFKDFVEGDFFVVKYLKKHTILLQGGVAYGVVSLFDPLQDMLRNVNPAYIKTVLLPYKGKIVYDGFLYRSPVYFGGGIRTSVNREYNEAKANYGIVTQLPFVKPKKKTQSPEDKLNLYMKNAKNRKYYYYEIGELLEAHPELEGKYNWHLGKINSRQKKKRLKELGLHGLHYAMVNDILITQGESARQVKEMAEAMLPEDKWDWVYYFSLT
ncbi:MAG: hypothetical protein AAGI38_15045, partial [Bacteroidota bacterium]